MKDQNNQSTQGPGFGDPDSIYKCQEKANLDSPRFLMVRGDERDEIEGFAIDLVYLYLATSQHLKWIEVEASVIARLWRAPISHFYQHGILIHVGMPMIFLPYRHWSSLRRKDDE